MKYTKLLFTTLIIISVAVMLITIVTGSQKSKQSPSIVNLPATPIPIPNNAAIFFYGNTCPHCAEVETWMEENKVENKITLVKKEVYDNQQNAQELIKTAQSCGLPTGGIGVPFLYAEGKCIIGTPDVITYLSKKAAVTTASSSAERSAP